MTQVSRLTDRAIRLRLSAYVVTPGLGSYQCEVVHEAERRGIPVPPIVAAATALRQD